MKAFRIIVVLLSLAANCDARSQPMVIAGREVALIAVDAVSLAPLKIDTENIHVKTRVISVSNLSEIYFVLRQRRIAPDVDAISLVYELNPSIEDLGLLPPNTRVAVPELVFHNPSNFNTDYSVQLRLDSSKRDRLSAQVDALQLSIPNLSAILDDRDTISHLDSLLHWFTDIQRAYRQRLGPPQRLHTLSQLLAESTKVRTIVDEGLRNRKVGLNDESKIADIFDDISLEMTYYNQLMSGQETPPERYRNLTVSLVGGDELTNSNIRIYYVCKGLYELPLKSPPNIMFTRIGGGRTERVPGKAYFVWGALDERPDVPVTARAYIKLDGSSPLNAMLDLSVLKERK